MEVPVQDTAQLIQPRQVFGESRKTGRCLMEGLNEPTDRSLAAKEGREVDPARVVLHGRMAWFGCDVCSSPVMRSK